MKVGSSPAVLGGGAGGDGGGSHGGDGGGTDGVVGYSVAAKMSHCAKAWAAVASFNLKATDDDQSGVVLCSATGVIRDCLLYTSDAADE